MSNDVGAVQALPLPVEEPRLRPIVSWPATMAYRQRYLVSVDLALVNSDGTPAPWPLEEEEYTYTCLLDGGGVFDLWAVHDASVVLHRFGGSYGPAEFVVSPDKPVSGEQSIWLTIINQWGVSVADYPLAVDVRVPQGELPTVPDVVVKVPAGLTPDGEFGASPDPDQAVEYAEILDFGDQTTVDIPHRELPDVHRDPGPGRDRELATANVAAPLITPTAPDLLYPDEEAGTAEDRAKVTRRDAERDWETGPYDEPTVPARRDTARLTVRGLQEFYNVAGLRRSRSGQLLGDMVPLFPPGSARGSHVTFTAYCSPSDDRGTVFAVVAQPEEGLERRPEPRSIQSAKIPPGVYQITAELLHPQPGHVRFHGLPAEPREDPRPWPEIAATVPRRLPANGGPAHLIIAVETSAPNDSILQDRLDKARQLILEVSAEASDFVCYSVITYGPHLIHYGNRDYPEQDNATLAWAATADDAIDAFDQASRRGPEPLGYEWAAQLECMLTDLEHGLTGREGRPVIVTVGTRPPHPPRIDHVTGIIPCRRRIDWTAPMSLLETEYAGIKFGAIRDTGLGDQLWRRLGADALSVGDFYAQGFARTLGLVSATARPSAPPIALPLFAGSAAGQFGPSRGTR